MSTHLYINVLPDFPSRSDARFTEKPVFWVYAILLHAYMQFEHIWYTLLYIYLIRIYQYLSSNDKNMQLDDALSATRLHDGRIKVWIHVADASSFVEPGSMIDRYI